MPDTTASRQTRRHPRARPEDPVSCGGGSSGQARGWPNRSFSETCLAFIWTG